MLLYLFYELPFIFVSFQEAPSLLIGLINMFMFIAPNASEHNFPVYGAPSSHIQYYIQVAIVLLAVICIPWMLITKPVVLYKRHKKSLNEMVNAVFVLRDLDICFE